MLVSPGVFPRASALLYLHSFPSWLLPFSWPYKVLTQTTPNLYVKPSLLGAPDSQLCLLDISTSIHSILKASQTPTLTLAVTMPPSVSINGNSVTPLLKTRPQEASFIYFLPSLPISNSLGSFFSSIFKPIWSMTASIRFLDCHTTSGQHHLWVTFVQ